MPCVLCKQDGYIGTPEEAVGDHEHFVVAIIHVLGYVLGADDKGKRVIVGLQQIFSQAYGDEAGGATHAHKVEALDVVAHVQSIVGSEGRGGIEEGRVEDEDIEL